MVDYSSCSSSFGGINCEKFLFNIIKISFAWASSQMKLFQKMNCPLQSILETTLHSVHFTLNQANCKFLAWCQSEVATDKCVDERQSSHTGFTRNVTYLPLKYNYLAIKSFHSEWLIASTKTAYNHQMINSFRKDETWYNECTNISMKMAWN